jgi:hypothetical protein
VPKKEKWNSGNVPHYPLQGEENLSTGHILKTAIGLSPVPLLTEDPGNMLSALVPMTVDGGLDRRDVLLGDGSFSDGKRQHFDCIAEEIKGRQQKMQGNEKILGRVGGSRNGSDLWVEMQTDGLKTGWISGSSQY